MARTGINKQLVQQAKTALLAQGKRPTIDALRIALGNTGSKSTISHYLKELDEPPKATLERLTEPLAQLVHSLGEQLQAEANEQLSKAQAQFLLETTQLHARLQRAQQHLEEQQQSIDNLTERRLTEQQQWQEATRRMEQQAQELSLAQQSNHELTRMLQEQQTKIALLENEQQHTNVAFEQFRQARQEMLDAIIQQHAKQIALLKEERRQQA
ncbi:MAG: DNA-binding protein, partial [Pseudomonas sp.]